jgi:hypothetical protein
MGPRRRRLTAALLAAVGAFAVWPASAAPAPSSDAPLFLTSFVQRGRTDVRRNEVLEFRFTAPLRRASVDERTLQVNELVAEGRRPVVGARIVRGHVVLLDPRRTQRNYDASLVPNSFVTERDHEIGFSASAAFEIRIPAAVDRRVLRTRDGRRIAQRYVGHFATNARYLDPDPGQPSFAGVAYTGLLDFTPPRDAATGIVAADASIVLCFSEPIAPESMRLGDTVIVRHATNGSDVAGTLAPAPGDDTLFSYWFTPAGGWGFDSQGQGWDVVVSLTTGITDLAGNALKRPVNLPSFRTAASP